MKIDYTIVLSFKVKGSEWFDGETGYIQTKSDVLSGSDFDIPGYCEKQRNAVAKMAKVPVENVEIVPRKEYEQNTEE